ncbi:hypothetical protein EDB80DRAFT_893436 [Ilyonectria destructans]|nr:hypothetical protein EDB80DRAFT_893436 [Ilyonectria destructans]
MELVMVGTASSHMGPAPPRVPDKELAGQEHHDDDSGYSSSSHPSGFTYFGRVYRQNLEEPASEGTSPTYHCPHDEEEMNRIDDQGFILGILFQDKLHFAPLSTDSQAQILDIGTGTGLWATDMSMESPFWEITGVDLSWHQSQEYGQPNVRFITDDARKKWEFAQEFDYIHTRATLHMGCWGNFKQEIIQQAYDNLRPGGWFESQEITSLVGSHDGSLPPDSPLSNWFRELNTASALIDRPRHISADTMLQWYRDVGFVDIHQKTFQLPIGIWPKDPYLKRLGLVWAENLKKSLNGLSVRLFNKAFGHPEAVTQVASPALVLVKYCSAEQFIIGQEMLSHIGHDIDNPFIHACTTVEVVYGRKPRSDEVAQFDLGIVSAGVATVQPKSEPGREFATWSPRPSFSSNDRGCSEASHDAILAEPTLVTGLSERSRSSSTDRSAIGSSDNAHGSDQSSSAGSECPSSDWLFRRQRRMLIDRIMSSLCRYLDSKTTKAPEPPFPLPVAETEVSETCTQTVGTSSELQDESGYETRNASNGAPARRDPTQHRAPNEGGRGRDDESDGDNRRKRRRVIAPHSHQPGTTMKLACPYYKRNRRKYKIWTSCPGPGWDEIHRVKAHLYRRHALPLQCPRCWEPFRAEDALREHLQQDPPCGVQVNEKILDGFTKDQEKTLRCRKKTRAGMSEGDKWRDVYKILFPDDDFSTMPTPYYDESDDQDKSSVAAGRMEDYSVFLRREMPGMVRRELETMFKNELDGVEERLRPLIEQMVLQLQPRLLRSFQESQTATDGTQEELERQELQQNTPLQDKSLERILGEPVLDTDPWLPPYAYPDGFEYSWALDQSVSEMVAEHQQNSACDIDFEKLLNPSFLNAGSRELG